MDNSTIADQFSLLSKLMDIHGENSFKSKTYSVAAFNIDKLPMQLADSPREKLSGIRGVGQSVADKVEELLETGEMALLNEYLANTPPGVVEMLHIKGLGPKKINTVWKELGISTIGELLYACEENRLLLYKGFGEKTQQNIRESIEFYLHHQGSFLYAQVDAVLPQVSGYLQKTFAPAPVLVTGDFRRQSPVITELSFVTTAGKEDVRRKFQTAQPPELLEETDNSLLYQLKNGLRLRLFVNVANLPESLFATTGSEAFIKAFHEKYPDITPADEKSIDDSTLFAAAGLPYIPPCLRESASILERAEKGALPELIDVKDIKGIIHSHSNWSDGLNTIEEMAVECRKRGLEYLVISDHSKSAFYANGLSEERIREQHRYVDELNEKLAPFRIFKSIECDILNDGSLDYADKVLADFDLVITSIHSNLGMTEEKAMSRLMGAITNPYTTILGHMTGRLLLSRNGYPVDHCKIIEACVAHNVVIEINAHPRRLDIDWQWIDYALSHGALLSIDPDAHALEGFNDIRYGVLAAQKGGLTKERNLSSFSLEEFDAYVTARKKKRVLQH